MNRLFNRGRKYKMLSLLIALAMLFSLLPTNTVLAETTVSGGDANAGIAVVSEPEVVNEPVVSDENANVVPTTLEEVTETPVAASFNARTTGPSITYDWHNTCFEDVSADYPNDLFALKYETAVEWCGYHVNVSGHDYRYYDKVEITVTPSRPGMEFKVEGGGGTLVDWTTMSDAQTFTVPLSANVSKMSFYFDTYPGRAYASTTGPITVVVNDVKFIAAENPPTGDENPEGGNNGAGAVQPTLTKGYIGECYKDVTEEQNGAVVAVSYTTAVQWNQVYVAVAGHDVAVHDTVLVDISPSRTNMNLCIQDQSGTIYDWSTLDGRKTLEIPVTRNIETFRFMFDSQEGGYEAGEEITAIVHSIKFVNSNDLKPEEPSGPQTMAEINEIECESGYGFTIDETTGSAVYVTSNKLRVKAYVPDNYTFTVGDVVTINYSTNMSDIGVYYGWKNSSPDPVKFGDNDGKLTASETENSLSYTITDVSVFESNTGNEKEFIRFKSDSGTEGSYLNVSSITITRGGEEEDDKPDVSGEPTVTIDTNSKGYTFVTNNDGSYTVTYEAQSGWDTINVAINNPDPAKYSKLVLDITPVAGMNIGIWNTNGTAYRSHYGNAGAINSATRTKLEYDFVEGTTGLVIYCDPKNDSELTGQQTFILHSIILVDPTAMPAGSKAQFTDFTVANNAGFTMGENKPGGYANITYPAGNTLRFWANYTGYTYNPGDLLVVRYDGIDDWSTIEAIMGTGTSSSAAGGDHIVLDKPVVKGNIAVFVLPEDKNGVLSDKLPTMMRFKGTFSATGTSTTFTGMGIYDASMYREFIPEDPVIEPKITITQSSKYTRVNNEDGSMTFTYDADTIGYNTINVNIVGYDLTKYNQIQIDITPALNMDMGIYNNEKVDGHDYIYRSHAGRGIFESTDRVTLKYDIHPESTGFKIYCDASTETNVNTGSTTFTIHSIKLVDPRIYSKANFSGFAGSGYEIVPGTESDGGKVDITYTANSEVKFIPKFTDYEYNAGDVLVINYEGIDDISKLTQVVIADTASLTTYETLTNPVVKGKTAVYTLPETTKFSGETQPTAIRLKGVFSATGTTTKFNSMAIYDAEEYARYVEEHGVYIASQVPQGLVVTYYNDIYSRGVAWNTDNTVTDNSLWYIKATDGQTAADVDWTAATEVKVNAADIIKTTASDGVEWHTFRAHVENLEKGAKYFFRAGNEKTGWSEVGTFTIAGDVNAIDGKLTFLHVTDSQSETKDQFALWGRVLEQAFTKVPGISYVAHTGDIVNDSESGEVNMNQWNYAFDVPKTHIMNTVLAPATGNHEDTPFSFTNRFEIEWADYLKDSNEDIETGGCYSFTYGDNVVFISLNTNDTNDYSVFEREQVPWLKAELDKYADYKWKIVQIHKSIMTAGNHTNDGESEAMRTYLAPILAQYEVDLVLQGHDHVYTRTRSYYYGKDFDGNDYDGHTPIWLDAIEETRTVNGESRTVYIEPKGTHYVNINTCGPKKYPEEPEDVLSDVIFEGVNPINPELGCMVQPLEGGDAMYGVISIDGDLMVYDTYMYEAKTRESVLFDTFAVDKSSDRGYDPNNRNEGKTEVTLSGITVANKTYDGKPAVMSLDTFVCSEPSIMDYTAFEFEITGTMNKAVDGSKEYMSTTTLPTEKGTYTMTVTIDPKHRYFYGSQVITFSIN